MSHSHAKRHGIELADAQSQPVTCAIGSGFSHGRAAAVPAEAAEQAQAPRLALRDVGGREERVEDRALKRTSGADAARKCGLGADAEMQTGRLPPACPGGNVTAHCGPA